MPRGYYGLMFPWFTYGFDGFDVSMIPHGLIICLITFGVPHVLGHGRITTESHGRSLSAMLGTWTKHDTNQQPEDFESQVI